MDGADSPFLLPSSSSSSSSLHHSVKRTGSLWTAVAHIITGVIGSGVLSLAWSMAQLGWIAGPLSMLFFALITAVSAFLLCDTYRSPDPEFGTIRNRSYIDAVRFNLGTKNCITSLVIIKKTWRRINFLPALTTFQETRLLRAIQKSNCYHSEGHQAACKYGHTEYMLLFGAFQLFMSQIPNFHEMEWLSVVAAVMSCVYSSVGLGLGLAKTIGDKKIKGSISGVAASSVIKKVWLVAQALGDIAFAYPYSLILLEIQDTLKSPPPENETMKKASTISISITTLFYLSCGGFGYAAFGDDTPGNLLTGFGFYEPYWLIDLANACIVVHLVGGYQIYSQPVFGAIDRWLMEKYPDSKFINHDHILNLPFLPGVRLNLSKLCYRSIYVASSTAIAMLFPYFNQVLGVLGGLNFWPVAIYFPVEMYLVQKNVARWSAKWVLLQIFSAACFSVTLFALVGSIEGVLAEKLS